MENKVALITGGAQGIGMAIALKMASKGFDIALNCRQAKKATSVLDGCRQFGVTAECFAGDVSDFDAMAQMVSEAKDRFSHIDVVVNNAGITEDGLIARMGEEQFDQVIDTNLKGVFNVCRHVSPILIRQRSGKIINISSVVGIGGNAGQVNYAASKAGVNGLTKSLAKELAPRNITVNAVAPGFIESHMTETLSDRVRSTILSGIALGRFGQPEEVASLVTFLASDEANYINGQIIAVDGGMLR